MKVKHITEIPLNDTERWNKIVRSFKDYEVFYLNEYSKAFSQENHQKSVPILLFYENGSDRAVNVVLQRDVADDPMFYGKIQHGKYFDLITPYGYGGFWGGVSDWDGLNAEYENYCIKHGYICEFVRFELFSNYHQFYDGKVESRTQNIVRNLEIPIEDIWMDFKGKVRRNVKRANTYGLEVIEDENGAYLDEFLRIYYMTMDKDGASPFYYFSRDFFETLLELKENIMFFHVRYQNRIISTEIVLYSQENAYFYLGGSDREYSIMRPNDLLKFEIIKWCKRKGLKNYILGGGYGSDDELFRYKQCLAPCGNIQFYTGRKIYDQEKYDYLVSVREKENKECRNSMFFPQYRA